MCGDGRVRRDGLEAASDVKQVAVKSTNSIGVVSIVAEGAHKTQ